MTAGDSGSSDKCTVAIVGGGTSGLALASALKMQGVNRVVVLERESDAGGIPRHCGHYPFGVHEYGRLLKGPDYARRNIEAATSAGVDIRTGVTVTSLHAHGRLSVTTTAGIAEMQADRVVLCTGVRESSRAQRFIGGDRPLGVLSTGALQSMVYLQGLKPFSRPVIVGSELVSFSAIGTCRHLGIRPVAMIEESDRVKVRRVMQPYLKLRGVPLFTDASSLEIKGRERVERIEFTDATGSKHSVQTDGVIISGDFRPEAALLRSSHLEIDAGSGGPVVNQYGQCSDPSYYCAGNLLRAAETSAWCWQEGAVTAKWIADDLSQGGREVKPSVKINTIDPELGYVIPQRLSLSQRAGGMQKMQIGLRVPVEGQLQVASGGRRITSTRLNSRPLRRIQVPLTLILESSPESPVELSILWGSR